MKRSLTIIGVLISVISSSQAAEPNRYIEGIEQQLEQHPEQPQQLLLLLEPKQLQLQVQQPQQAAEPNRYIEYFGGKGAQGKIHLQRNQIKRLQKVERYNKDYFLNRYSRDFEEMDNLVDTEIKRLNDAGDYSVGRFNEQGLDENTAEAICILRQYLSFANCPELISDEYAFQQMYINTEVYLVFAVENFQDSFPQIVEADPQQKQAEYLNGWIEIPPYKLITKFPDNRYSAVRAGVVFKVDMSKYCFEGLCKTNILEKLNVQPGQSINLGLLGFAGQMQFSADHLKSLKGLVKDTRENKNIKTEELIVENEWDSGNLLEFYEQHPEQPPEQHPEQHPEQQ